VSRILLIDDDSQVNEVVKATLEMLGHTVTAVEHAENVESVFSCFEPDVTLIDYMLPGLSGIDLLKQLGSAHPESMRFLATGMGDFKLLEQALKAGASSMLCKPYRLADVISLIDMAVLLEAALKIELNGDSNLDDDLSLHRSHHGRVNIDDLALVIGYAHHHGAEPGVAARRLPVIAYELMKNAVTHGAHAAPSEFSLALHDDGSNLDLVVSDSGPGFDDAKVLARAHAVMDKSRASGLQVVLAASDKLWFTDGGRSAHVRLAKTVGSDV
jgi:CheY-like chemotaxis protein